MAEQMVRDATKHYTIATSAGVAAAARDLPYYDDAKQMLDEYCKNKIRVGSVTAIYLASVMHKARILVTALQNIAHMGRLFKRKI